MRRGSAFVVIASMFCAACVGGEPAGRTEAARTADAPASSAGRASAAGNPLCGLFSQAEVATYIGEPVSAPEDVALGCQWVAADGSGDVIIAVVPATDHEPPSRSDGYKALTEPGREAFVAPYLGGWLAGAITGENAIRLSVDGAGASEATAVALLKDTASRQGNRP